MKELVWINKQIEAALFLLEEHQEDSVFYYIHSLSAPTVRELTSYTDYSLSQIIDKQDLYGTDEESNVEEDFSVGFDDFDFDFELDDSVYLDEVSSEIVEVEDRSSISVLFSDESVPFTASPKHVLVFTDSLNHFSKLMKQLLPSFSRENLFPSDFHFDAWLERYNGLLYVVYNAQPSIYMHAEGKVKKLLIEDIEALEKKTTGIVIIALSDPVIQISDWCRRTEVTSETRNELLLLEYPMKRHMYQYIQSATISKVVLMSGSNQKYKLVERVSTLPSIVNIQSLEQVNYKKLMKNVAQIRFIEYEAPSLMTEFVSNGMIELKSNLNLWLNKQTSASLEQLVSNVVVNACNEWWIRYSPNDQEIMFALYRLAKMYCIQIEKIDSEMHTLRIDSTFESKEKAYKRIVGCYEEIIKELKIKQEVYHDKCTSVGAK